MSQFNQMLNSTIKDKENELQALYLLQNKDKPGLGQAILWLQTLYFFDHLPVPIFLCCV